MFAQRLLHPADPLDLLAATHQRAVVAFEDLDAVSAMFLRRLAGNFRGCHQTDDTVAVPAHRDDADAGRDVELPIRGDDAQIGDRGADLLGDLLALLHTAIHEQHGELVAAEPREDVAVPQQTPQQFRRTADECVALLMTQQFVDDVQLVEIDMQQTVLNVAASRDRERCNQCRFETHPVDQSGQRVMMGVNDSGRLLGHHLE